MYGRAVWGDLHAEPPEWDPTIVLSDQHFLLGLLKKKRKGVLWAEYVSSDLCVESYCLM